MMAFGAVVKLYCVECMLQELHHDAFCRSAQYSTVSSILSLGRRGKVCSRPELSSGRDAAGCIRFEPRTREESTWQMAIKTTY
jgi:hypothetical protein